MPNRERNSWRAWCLMTKRGAIATEWGSGESCLMISSNHKWLEALTEPGETIVRVTITVDETKKKGKVGRATR